LLATELATGEPIESVAVIGTGVIARMHIALLLRYLPELRTLYLFDLIPAHVERLQKELEPTLLERHIQIRSMDQVQAAVRPAQLVIAVTTTTEGYIPYHWLRKGAIVLNVSLDDILPEVVLNVDTVVVDDWMLVKNDTRRLLGRMYRQGTIIGPDDTFPESSARCRRVDAQLGELVIGHKRARKHRDDIILINPFGLAIEDVALAAKVYQIALAQGLGQKLSR
jgi:ornithine cyclodeaminase